MIATSVSREQVVRNWGGEEVAPPPEPVTGPLPRALNLANVMDLGNMVFFMFRGRAFGIPPLAWPDGEDLLDAWLAASAFPSPLKREDLKKYYRQIRQLSRLIWKHCRPTGPFRRLLRFFRIHPNPFRLATEAEIAELAVFLLGRRMMSRTRDTPMPDAPNPGTS